MLTLNVKVIPGARADRVVGRYADGIKVQVSAPPEDGKANKAVLRVLSGVLGIRADQIEVLRGKTSPRKLLSISGIEQAALRAWVQSLPE